MDRVVYAPKATAIQWNGTNETDIITYVQDFLTPGVPEGASVVYSHSVDGDQTITVNGTMEMEGQEPGVIVSVSVLLNSWLVFFMGQVFFMTQAQYDATNPVVV